MAGRDEEFTTYVTTRMPWLRRVAYARVRRGRRGGGGEGAADPAAQEDRRSGGGGRGRRGRRRAAGLSGSHGRCAPGRGRGAVLLRDAHGAQAASRPLKPNTTIDGHPAFDSRLPHPGPKAGGSASRTQMLSVYGVRGFDISIDASGAPLRRLQASGGLTGLYRRITPLGTDPANWTTTPLK